MGINIKKKVIISDNDKRDTLSDVKAIKEANETELSKVDERRRDIELCDQLLATLDTEERARIETENRLSKMESRFDKLEELMERIASKTI